MMSVVYHILNALGALSSLFFVVIIAAASYFVVIKRTDIWESIKKDRAHLVGGAVPVLAIGLLRIWMLSYAVGGDGQLVDWQSDGAILAEGAMHSDTAMILKWWSALWALGLIMSSVVVWGVPGSVIGFPPEYAPFLKVSPWICAIDVINVVWELATCLTGDVWGRRIPRGGDADSSGRSSQNFVGRILERIAERKFENVKNEEYDDDRVENGYLREKDTNGHEKDGANGGHTNVDTARTMPNSPAHPISNTPSISLSSIFPGRIRALMFLAGSLHPAVTLFTCKGPGVILTQTMAGSYLMSFLVDELLHFFYTKRKPGGHKSPIRKIDRGSTTVTSRPSSLGNADLAAHSDIQPHPAPSLNDFSTVGRYIVSSSAMITTLCICLCTVMLNKLEFTRMSVVSLISASSMILIFLADSDKITIAVRWRGEILNMFYTVTTMQCFINIVDSTPSPVVWWWIIPSWLMRWYCAIAAIYFASRTDRMWAKYDVDKSGHPPIVSFALITVVGMLLYFYGLYDASTTYKPNLILWILKNTFGS